MGLVDYKFSMSQRNHMVAKNSLIGYIRRNMVSGWKEVRDPFPFNQNMLRALCKILLSHFKTDTDTVKYV